MIDKGISYDIPQLVKPKGDGSKRQGYRGEAAAASDAASNRNAGRSDTGSASGRGDGPATGGGGDNNREQYSVKRTVTPKTQEVNIGPVGNVQGDTGLERQRKINEKILDTFKNYRPDINIPEFSKFPTLFNLGLNLFEKPLQKFSDFTTAKNREFFENVIRAGNIPGLNFANLTDLDIKQAYQDYMDDRMSGKTDAYGREINRDQGASGILQNLLMPLAPILESQEGITSIIPSQSFNYAYTPDRRIVIAPGTALGREKVTI